MQFYVEQATFQAPLVHAIAAARTAVETAPFPVKGTQDRLHRAKTRFADLKTFRDRVADHIQNGSFADLPRLRWRGGPMAHLHHLTVGDWRGVFLVDPGGTATIGLVFSEAPHDIDDLVRASFVKHRPDLDQDTP